MTTDPITLAAAAAWRLDPEWSPPARSSDEPGSVPQFPFVAGYRAGVAPDGDKPSTAWRAWAPASMDGTPTHARFLRGFTAGRAAVAQDALRGRT